jgi:WD40 repeat protein
VKYVSATLTSISIFYFGSAQELPESSSSGPSHTLIARLPSAHGVSDVNTVAWCPRDGLADFLATAGDDGHVRVWRVSSLGSS